MITEFRDIKLIEKDPKTYIAVACDISAGIGNKEMDTVKVSPEIAGYYASAVPIIELIAIEAEPMMISDTIGVEMFPTGQEIIVGIHKAMDEAGIERDCLTGSTEDNMITSMTSIGITIMAVLAKDKLQSLSPSAGERIYVVGLPKMGRHFLEDEILGSKGEVITIELVKKIRGLEGISHMLPVGSKGIGYELDMMIETYGLIIEEDKLGYLDLKASAGPATCMLVSCSADGEAALKKNVTVPIIHIGTILETGEK